MKKMNDKLESREREKEVAAMFKKFIPASFSATLLRIGKFSFEPLNEANLKARCYFDKRKLVWAMSDKGKNINKIEVMWDNISAIRALAEENNPGILEIELIKEPTFHREIYLGPRIHPRFELSEDFTDGHASIYRRHYLVFLPGVLGKHYEKLLQSDNRLLELSQRPFPFFESPYFGPPLLYDIDIDEGSMDKSHVHDLIDIDYQQSCDSSSTSSK